MDCVSEMFEQASGLAERQLFNDFGLFVGLLVAVCADGCSLRDSNLKILKYRSHVVRQFTA